MASWTDEKKAELIKKYEDAKPTEENSMEIVAELAEEFDATANGARNILSRAGVYIKKNTAKGTAKGSAKPTGEKKESKAESIERLNAAIGDDVDEEITGKLTGKAAAYFADVITKTTEE